VEAKWAALRSQTSTRSWDVVSLQGGVFKHEHIRNVVGNQLLKVSQTADVFFRYRRSLTPQSMSISDRPSSTAKPSASRDRLPVLVLKFRALLHATLNFGLCSAASVRRADILRNLARSPLPYLVSAPDNRLCLRVLRSTCSNMCHQTAPWQRPGNPLVGEAVLGWADDRKSRRVIS